ncbi:MAG: endolytic transglycosylase MltG [Candidatus Microsyncoccus archaeolyticus]|nr:MAG: endolytic transglycosylase MltG [Candidatus Parcubacteria bacterium]
MNLLKISFFILISSLFLVLFFPKNIDFEEKTIIITSGETIINIASDLENQGIIKNRYVFLLTAFIKNDLKNIQAGNYLLNSKMSNNEIINMLASGKTIKNKITIPEGWTNKEIADYLESKELFNKESVLNSLNSSSYNYEFLTDKPNDLGLEGYVFPDTYFLETDESLENTIKIILSNFDKKLSPELREEILKQNKTIFQIITMASLIEKEVITYEDKQLVSGILWKRIDANMPLQVDATIIYALGQKKESISVEDTKIDSPYNTYKYRGLPIGPICNPGFESIKAAIYPKESSYWYYLSKSNKETVFSKTLEEHNVAKNKYLK